jgi:sialic acid synthase SpsE
MPELTIVAEIGSSWRVDDMNESHSLALQSIREAYLAHATAVKFQLHTADTLYSATRAPEQHTKLKRYELPLTWLPNLRDLAHSLEMQFWLSVFAVNLVPIAADYADVLKVASGDLVNEPLVRAVARECDKRNLPMVLSTGAAYHYEVCDALDWIKDYEDVPHLILMQCISKYPANEMDYNLKGIVPFVNSIDAMGLSDHTHSVLPAQVAVGLGYTVFEKHMMPFSADAKNPEAGVALYPDAFSDYVADVRRAWVLVGNLEKKPRGDEMNERLWARRGTDGLRPTEEAVR